MTRTVVSHGRRIEVETDSTVIDVAPRQQHGKRNRHMGAPWAFWVAVCEAKLPWVAVVLAIYIYRRTKVARSDTVTLPSAELKELGIDRHQRSRALRRLAAAGIVRLTARGVGRSVRVTLARR